ncbi:hypothetical protein Mapa_014669 [Marchantia paleacea]|nr:hypothetical protein Mapa_014669 [Marchantia paleacea]
MGVAKACVPTAAARNRDLRSVKAAAFKRDEMAVGGESSASLRLKKRGLAAKALGEMKLSQVATPLGPLSLGVSGAGLHMAYFDTWWGESTEDDTGNGAADVYMREAKVQVGEYFGGRRNTFSIPLIPEGTPFQKKAWAVLEQIPFGRTVCYEEQAKLMNEPGKARAVGAANGKNPICLFIPCHRVIAKGGKLCGYAHGSENKKFLLDFEMSKLTI